MQTVVFWKLFVRKLQGVCHVLDIALQTNPWQQDRINTARSILCNSSLANNQAFVDLDIQFGTVTVSRNMYEVS